MNIWKNPIIQKAWQRGVRNYLFKNYSCNGAWMAIQSRNRIY